MMPGYVYLKDNKLFVCADKMVIGCPEYDGHKLKPQCLDDSLEWTILHEECGHWATTVGLNPTFNHESDSLCFGGCGKYYGELIACVCAKQSFSCTVSGDVEHQNEPFDYFTIYINNAIACGVHAFGEDKRCDLFTQETDTSSTYPAGIYRIRCYANSGDQLYHRAGTGTFTFNISS